MRTFYIFKINNDYYKITKNMPYNLYKALLNIKLGTKENITYLKNEYNSIVDKYNNPSYINTDYLKHVSFEQLKEDLKYQETRDPLKLAFKEGIHYKHFYKLLYDNEMETIVKNCIRLNSSPIEYFPLF